MVEKIKIDVSKSRASFDNIKFEIKDGTDLEIHKMNAWIMDFKIHCGNTLTQNKSMEKEIKDQNDGIKQT